jgi:hypothetical protein
VLAGSLGSASCMAPWAQIRLLMCYVATHPEKMDATKSVQWQKLARLSLNEMNTITSLELLGVPVRKKAKPSGLYFGVKRKRMVRKVRPQQQTWRRACCAPAGRVARLPGA